MEEKLDKYRKKLDMIDVPESLLDEAIEAGFQKAKQEQKRRPRRIWILSVAMVAILLVGFSSIEKIMDLIQDDKGMRAAIEHDYYEEIGVSQKKKEVEFVIDGAIADESGIVIFYTIHTDKKQKSITTESLELKSSKGKQLDYDSLTYGGPHESEKGKKTYSGKIEYYFKNPLKERDFRLDIELKGDSVHEKFSLDFSLINALKEKKTFALNKTVTIEGQKVHFKEAVMYPLRVGIHVQIDPKNQKKILEFEDMRLEDEKGELWTKITNGITSTTISEYEFVYYLQSNYFKEPEELYLAFNKIQAVDKDYSAVVVDIEKEKILKQPPGNKLSGLEVSGQSIRLNLSLEKEFPYGIFSVVKDGDGHDMDIDSSFVSTYGEEGYQSVGISIPNLKSYPNPISLELSFFPEWIGGEERIRIK